MPDDASQADTKKRRALVVVIDRFSAGYLAPYGNTWVETPTLNELAADGLLFEHALAGANRLVDIYRSAMGGNELPQSQLSQQNLLTQLHAQGVSSRLITDDASVAELEACDAFDAAEVLAREAPSQLKFRMDETELGRIFAAATTTLQDGQADLTWVHCRGMAGAWDAPFQLRAQFADDDDPEPPHAAVAPHGAVPPDIDPDELQGWVWAYAGQVLLLDHCLGHLVDQLKAQTEPTLLIVVGARGVALGEHGAWITGDTLDAAAGLNAQLLHVPFLLSSNLRGQDKAQSVFKDCSLRSQTLVQHHHLYHTLVDWFGCCEQDDESATRLGSLLQIPGIELATDAPSLGEVAACVHEDLVYLRTKKWAASYGGSGPSRLYLKPDDRWDVNDVADRCPEIMAAFDALRDKLSTGVSDDRLRSLSPIDPVLITAPE